MLTVDGTITALAPEPAGASIAELSRSPAGPPAGTPAVARSGYDSDVPYGGATRLNPGGDYPDGRASFMQSLYVAYTGCPWLSAPIDAIARTVTAGGLKIIPSKDAGKNTSADRPTPKVKALQKLLDYCNPTQDIIQLLRGVVTDLGIYGDSFVEVVWLFGLPVALYSLDPATMTVTADEHGVVSGYEQTVDSRTVSFSPRQVIHIAMDSPKGSLYGMGIAQKAYLSTVIWMYTSACIKDTMRKGNPPHIHLDFPLEVQTDEVRAWRGQYQARNIGPGNIGNPITTRGGANLTELQLGKLLDYLKVRDACREEILSEAGVPPAKVGVIDSGNIGGGTGTSQDKTFRVNTCGPMEQIVLEKLNFALTREAFGIDDWKISFLEVDWRDDKIVEDIRDQRVKNGSYTLNDYLAEIGKPTIGPAGDVHVLVDRQNIVLWEEIGELSQAKIASLAKPGPGGDAPSPPGVPPVDGAPGAAKPDTPKPGDPPAATPPTSPAGAPAKTSTAKKAPATAEDMAQWRARVAEQYQALIAAA